MSETIGDRLRSLREARGLSQHKLATASGTCQQTISLIESGRRQPRIGTLLLLAEALGVRLSEFDDVGREHDRVGLADEQ